MFRSVRSEAQDLGVKIALENHSGDLQAREVKTIILESGRDFVASCLDTGNPIWCIEDPFVALETLAPYVVTTHVRDSVVFEHARGAAGQWVALGDGNVDLPRFVEQEFRAFLQCGWLAGGFARFRCGDCGLDRLVPLSCKGRALCPSCGGRGWPSAPPTCSIMCCPTCP